jgi:Flp pilus assembly protein TadD
MLRTMVIRNRREASMIGTILLAVTTALVIAGCGNGERAERTEKTGGDRVSAGQPAGEAPTSPAIPARTAGEGDRPQETVEAPEEPHTVGYDEAEAAFFDKRYDDAVELFTAYTERKSENPWGFYMLGLSAWKDGEYGVAGRAFEQALALDPRHVKSLINWSRVLLEMGEPHEALAKLDEALAIDPESSAAYRLLGRAYHQLGQPEEAVGAYRQAILLDEGDAWSMNNMALIFIEAGMYEEAVPPLARAVELRDDVGVFRNNLGMALEHTGDYRAALESYEAAVSLDSSAVRAQANLDRLAEVVGGGTEGSALIDLADQSVLFEREVDGWRMVPPQEDLASSDEASPGAGQLTGGESDAETAMAGEADSTVVEPR